MDDLENLTAGKKRRLEDPEFEKENLSKRKIRNEHVQEHALQSEIEEEINFSKASDPAIQQLGAQKGTSQGSVQIPVKADAEENVGREIHGNESTVEQPIISEKRIKGILIAREDESKELEERGSEKKHLECSEQKIDLAVLGDDTKESVEPTIGAEHDESIQDKGSSESSVKEGDDKDESIKKISEIKSPPTVQTFQQLSGIQNAFTGLSGTGFSSSSFTFDTKITSGFGSTPKFGSFNVASSGASPSLLSRESLFGQKQEANQESFATSVNSVCPSFIFGALDANRALSSTRKEVVFSEVAIQTGEEKEKTMFNADAVLFKYISGSWKERGKGELKINAAPEESGSVTARLIMRTKGNYRLILNANLYPEMKLTNMDKRGFSFTCLNSADDSEEGFKTFALKFKDSSIAEQFQVSLESHKSQQYADSRT